MTVSVALATYNGKKFLKAQLDSLLLSTRQPKEVIIIDDCSTDTTAELVKRYIAEHKLNWKFSIANSNSGYIRNFYNCLKQCTGDVIFLCDQDDVWYSEKIEKITEIFESDQEVLAVNSSFDIIDAKGDILKPFVNERKTGANHGLLKQRVGEDELLGIDLSKILEYNISPGCTCAFRREVVDEYIKTSKCVMPHDWELNIIAASRGGLRFYNRAFIGYRQHGNNAIGLSVDETFGPMKMRGSDDIRFDVLNMQLAQRDINIIYCDRKDKKQINFLKQLDRFCKNREKILYGKKLWPCFKNFLYYPYLKNVATIHFRGLIGDIIFVLKRKFKNRA